MFAGTLLGAALLLAQPQPAAPPPPQGDPNVVSGVVVEGRRKLTEQEQRKAESDFVRQHSAPTQRRRLPRWNGPVCPGVAGLPEDKGLFIAERIAEEARAVGLEVEGPGCKPGILILVTNDGAAGAKAAREKYRNLFPHPVERGIYKAGGGQSRESFVTTPRPVRWWHVSEFKGSDGRPIAMVDLADMIPGAPPGTYVPMLENAGASRVASAVREDLVQALIVVDTSQLRGVTYEELASYLAMVSLAQLDPDAETDSLPTILSLFKDRDTGLRGAGTLSKWDRAYLHGLYAAPDNSLSLHTQRGAIRRSLREAARK